MILWICWTVSDWSLFLAHPTDWNKCSTSEEHRSLPKVDLESSSLGTIPIDNAVPCFPRGNTVCINMYDKCKRSNDIIVCNMLSSILWQHVPVCSQTKEGQVYKFGTHIGIWGRFESTLLTILQPFPVLRFRTDGRPGMELGLCTVAQSIYLPVRSIFPRNSSHDPPCQKTKRLFSRVISPNQVTFQLLLRRFVIRTFLYSSRILSLDLHSRWVHPKYTWSRHDIHVQR